MAVHYICIDSGGGEQSTLTPCVLLRKEKAFEGINSFSFLWVLDTMLLHVEEFWKEQHLHVKDLDDYSKVS